MNQTTELPVAALPGHSPNNANIANIANLMQSPRQLVRALKWKRFRSDPWTCMLRRMRVPVPATDRLTELRNTPGWPQSVRAALHQIPRDFVTDWSLAADSGLWLYNHIRWSAYRTLVECGSGLSSILIGLALRDRARYFSQVRCYSLEHDAQWLEKTRWLLCRLNLSPFVEPIHAPLVRAQTGTGQSYTYDTALAPRHDIDFMLIDGPPHNVGRADVMLHLRRRLSPNAVVVLDDAGRRSEQLCCENWTKHHGLKLQGLLPLGHGLALLSTQPTGASVARL